jgi:PhnB protein
VRGAAQAIEFYKKAFGATELYRMPGPDGKIMHAEIQLGTARLYLADENPQMHSHSPQSLNGTSISLAHYVEKVDEVFKRATAAGAKSISPPADMFWGDRWSVVEDPFGHSWQIMTHVEDVLPEKMAERMKAASAGA